MWWITPQRPARGSRSRCRTLLAGVEIRRCTSTAACTPSAVQIAVPEPRDHRGHAAEPKSSRGFLELAHTDGVAAHFIDGLKTDFIARIVTDEHRCAPGEL